MAKQKFSTAQTGKAIHVPKSTEKLRRCIRIGCNKEFVSMDAADRVCPKCRLHKTKTKLGQPRRTDITVGNNISED